MENTQYVVHTVPFGYHNGWKNHVAGESLAKVFRGRYPENPTPALSGRIIWMGTT
jgi:hypothetical protein